MNQCLSLEEDVLKIYAKELNLEFGLIKIAMIYIKNITSSPGTSAKLQ